MMKEGKEKEPEKERKRSQKRLNHGRTDDTKGHESKGVTEMERHIKVYR